MFIREQVSQCIFFSLTTDTALNNSNNLILEDKLRLVFQLMDGVKYLHSNSILHASLSPSKLLITTKGALVIGDFVTAILLKVKFYLKPHPAKFFK